MRWRDEERLFVFKNCQEYNNEMSTKAFAYNIFVFMMLNFYNNGLRAHMLDVSYSFFIFIFYIYYSYKRNCPTEICV